MLMNGKFIEFEVSYSEPGVGQKKRYTSQTWLRLSGLKPGQVYHVFVNVRNTEGYYKPPSHMKGINIPGQPIGK